MTLAVLAPTHARTVLNCMHDLTQRPMFFLLSECDSPRTRACFNSSTGC